MDLEGCLDPEIRIPPPPAQHRTTLPVLQAPPSIDATFSRQAQQARLAELAKFTPRRPPPQITFEPSHPPSDDATVKPFYDACRQGRVDDISKLATQRQTTLNGEDDGTIHHGLAFATEADKPEAMRLLLDDFGARLHARVIEEARSKQAFEVLLAHGWTPNTGFGAGESAFARVVGRNNLPLARWFLTELKQDPNHGFVPLSNGLIGEGPLPTSGAALDNAARFASPEMLTLLLEHGAELRYSRALHCAVAGSKTLDTPAARREMLNSIPLPPSPDTDSSPTQDADTQNPTTGIDINALAPFEPLPGECAPLHVAAALNRVDEAQWLIGNGADPLAKTSRGNTAWDVAGMFFDQRTRDFESDPLLGVLRAEMRRRGVKVPGEKIDGGGKGS